MRRRPSQLKLRRRSASTMIVSVVLDSIATDIPRLAVKRHHAKSDLHVKSALPVLLLQ